MKTSERYLKNGSLEFVDHSQPADIRWFACQDARFPKIDDVGGGVFSDRLDVRKVHPHEIGDYTIVGVNIEKIPHRGRSRERQAPGRRGPPMVQAFSSCLVDRFVGCGPS